QRRLRECPRQELNLALDLRTVVCLRHTPGTGQQCPRQQSNGVCGLRRIVCAAVTLQMQWDKGFASTDLRPFSCCVPLELTGDLSPILGKSMTGLITDSTGGDAAEGQQVRAPFWVPRW